MARDEAFADVRDVLADLYLDEASAARVAADAGIELSRVDLGGSALNRWRAILREAENTGRVEALFAVVLGEYESNAELHAAIDAYRQDEEPGEPEGSREGSGGRWPVRRWLPIVIAVAVVGVVAVIGYGAYRNGQGAPMPTVTTSVPTVTPTDMPTPEATPDFIDLHVYDANWDVERVEFDFEEGIVPTETISDFLRMERLSFVEFGDGTRGFSVHAVVTNTGERPLLLTLDPRFFSFDDDQGRKGTLLYFCCAAQGEFLAPGQERTVHLLFRAVPGWEGKRLRANSLFFRVRGLLPIVRAGWRVPALAAAE